jgi:hypothetical protein
MGILDDLLGNEQLQNSTRILLSATNKATRLTATPIKRF